MIKLRKASSMIELVIAIVVMGIAVMTLPLMLDKTQTNNAFAMQQEAILAARTQIGDILTYPWDENSIQNDVVGVLNVHINSDDELDRNITIRRVGHVLADKRRKFFNADVNATTIINLGKDGAELIPNDIDDFSGVLTRLVNSGEDAGVLDYRYNLNMTTTVSYVNDSADYFATNIPLFTLNTNSSLITTNIKMVELTLRGSNLSKFTLRSYSTNIGGSQFLRRNW
ncbi:hypothetical protein N8972_01250 [Sulfurospirillum sp.]|nr:hypothetical protein [Sulfurospirillum sp.]